MMKNLLFIVAFLFVSVLQIKAQEVRGGQNNCQGEENISERIECLTRAVLSKDVRNDTFLYKKLESELSAIYKQRRNYAEQARQIERIKKWLSSNQNPDLLYWYYLMNADYNLFIKNEEVAIDFYEKCKELIPFIKDDINRCSVHNNLGVHYYRMGHLKEAMENYRLSLKCREHYKDTIGMARMHKNIGNLYLRGYSDDEVKSSLIGKEHWDRALELYEAIKDTTGGIIDLYFNYAYSTYLPDIRDRVNLLEKGIRIAEDNGNTDFLVDAFGLRGRLFSDLLDYKEAYESLVQRNVYQQEVIHGLQSQIAEKGNTDSESSSKDDSINEAGSKMSGLLIYILSLGWFLFIIGLGWVVYRKRKSGYPAESLGEQV